MGGRLERGLAGVGLLALHSGVPVVPAGIRGTYEALAGRRFYVPRRQPLRRSLRPAATLRDGGVSRRPRAARRLVTEQIMTDIADLLV